MAKTKSSKIICPACNGNGYRRIIKDAASKIGIAIDCEACDNQGEVKNDEKTIFGLRYLKSVH